MSPHCAEPVPRHAGAETQVLPDSRWALFLDVDGTLLNLKEHPDAVEVNDLMKTPPFRRRRPVFVGDDVTEVDASLAVNVLGGYSMRVGNGRASKTQYRLSDVIAVIDWLESLPRRTEVDESERKA